MAGEWGVSRESFNAGKLAGIRLAVDQLRKWAGEDDRAQAKALEDSADSLAVIADRLEEEEG